jgi:quinol monooxygenase YgiN
MTHLNVVSRYRTYSDASGEVLELLALMAEATRKEAGNLSFEVYQGLEDHREITTLETYQSLEDFDLHCRTPHYLSIAPGKIHPRLEQSSVSTYTSDPAPHEVP